MDTFKVIKEENGFIISILRISDNEILNIGDYIAEKENLNEGVFVKAFISKGEDITYPELFLPRGTIVTNKGFLSIESFIKI